MTTPTRQEILNAYDALESLKNVALIAADHNGEPDMCLNWKNEILVALPPKPQPTMAEIEWDDKKHYLAEAETEDGLTVIMLWKSIADHITVIKDGTLGPIEADRLTPTGYQYKRTEI